MDSYPIRITLRDGSLCWVLCVGEDSKDATENAAIAIRNGHALRGTGQRPNGDSLPVVLNPDHIVALTGFPAP